MPEYQAWFDPENNSVCLATKSESKRHLEIGLMSKESRLLWKFVASTFEEAMSIHNLRSGHGPYVPKGDPEECPTCSSYYYPNGSGECWKCNEKQAN